MHRQCLAQHRTVQSDSKSRPQGTSVRSGNGCPLVRHAPADTHRIPAIHEHAGVMLDGDLVASSGTRNEYPVLSCGVILILKFRLVHLQLVHLRLSIQLKMNQHVQNLPSLSGIGRRLCGTPMIRTFWGWSWPEVISNTPLGRITVTCKRYESRS